MVLNTLFLIGYVLLVGPPRAVEISNYANDAGDELRGKPIWVVILTEFVFRSGIFLIFAASIESLLGDQRYEQYQLDLFLGSLIFAGLIHTFSYYASYCLTYSSGHSLSRVYRLGRNFAYAILPAFMAAVVVLTWQDINDIELFSGGYIERVFFVTWCSFVILGLFEALLMKRIPTGLGEILLKRLKRA
jgi:hypothetical protein